MERSVPTTPFLAVTLILALVFTTLVGGTSVAAALPSGGAQLSQSQRFDGETLFRALAFAQGPAASRFPEFEGFKALTDQQVAAIDRLVARIRQNDPGFFQAFASIQNGNRPTIRVQLERAGARLHDAIVTEFGAPTSAGGQPACISLDIAVFVALVIVLDIAAVVTVVIDVTAGEVVNLVLTGNVALNTDFFFAPVAGGGVRLSPLAKDQWVDRVAQRLAG
jgi:SdpC family antimicrobial peptide